MPIPYRTLDNGGHPFFVEVQSQRKNNTRMVKIWKNNEETNNMRDTLLKTYVVKEFHVGIGEYVSHEGNSLLFELPRRRQDGKNKLVQVGDRVYEWETLDGSPVTDYFSPVGNSAVPYPYTVTDSWIQLMIATPLRPWERAIEGLTATNGIAALKNTPEILADPYSQFQRTLERGPSGTAQRRTAPSPDIARPVFVTEVVPRQY